MTSQKPAPQHDKSTQAKIEHICQQGCSMVRQTIEALEIDHSSSEQKPDLRLDFLPDLIRETTATQQQEILEELKTIMAVYDNKNCNDS